jgi:hypothetical protein
VLGEAVLKALGDRKGINRRWLLRHADGRNAGRGRHRSQWPPARVVDLKVRVRMVGDLQTELVHDFFDGFASGARANVHVKVLYGRSSHHHIEAVFKAFARALRVACAKGRAPGQNAAEHEGVVVIALVDYGAGNLTSVRKALTALGADFIVPSTPEECSQARGLIVPGVGNFGATARLDSRWRDAIGRAVASGTPLFGICVGMQWLFEGSDEAPDAIGFGAIAGRIARLDGDP